MFLRTPKNMKQSRLTNQHSDQGGNHSQPTQSTSITTPSSSSSTFLLDHHRTLLPETNRSDKIVSDLRHLHLRVAHAKCKRDEELVQSLRDVYDEQFALIRSLQRSINECNLEIEEEINLINLECTDDETQLRQLLQHYPAAMSYYCEKTTKRFEPSRKECRDKFELKKRQMMDENAKKLNQLKIKYDLKFRAMIDHLETDSSRLANMRIDFDDDDNSSNNNDDQDHDNH